MKAALSIMFEDLRGKAGSVVLQKGRSGLSVKPRVTGKNPRTPAQQAVRGYMAKAAQTYRSLTPAQLAAWQAYAQTVTHVNEVEGNSYHPAANSVFAGLAVKFLQMNPTGAVPTTPPASAFIGDSITVTAASPSAGTVVFTASGSNTLGVTTELLLQPLKSPARTPNPKDYRTKAFQAFASVTTKSLTVPPGTYAAAYRFVKTATGQVTPLVTLPVVITVALSVEQGGKKSPTKAA